MSEKELLNVLPPVVPCDECISNGGKLFKNDVAVCYCPHNSSIGIYHIKTKKWEAWSPVSEEEYQRAIQRAKARAERLESPNSWWNNN